MFAFAGASTFPTIQADMKDRSKFNYSAMIAMGGKNQCFLGFVQPGGQNICHPHPTPV